MRIQLLTLEACERFGIAYQTAAQAVRVCKAFERCVRIHLLTFTHHALVANRPDSAELLDWKSAFTSRLKQQVVARMRWPVGRLRSRTKARSSKGDRAFFVAVLPSEQ